MYSFNASRHYKTVQNWFSNRRANEKAAWKSISRGKSLYNPTSDYSDIFVDSRRLKIRNLALEKSPQWDDHYFLEVLMITNMRFLAIRLRYEDRAAEEEQRRNQAASALLLLHDDPMS